VEELQAFWHALAEFINVMVGYEAQAAAIPDPVGDFTERLMRREPVSLTSPAGFAARVIGTREHIDHRLLPRDERALYLQACEYFDKFLLQCGVPAGSDELWRLVPPTEGDTYFVALRKLISGRIPSPSLRIVGGRDSQAGLPDRVTLDQSAAVVNRSKRTLEHYKRKSLPPPTVEGGGGKPDLWDWQTIRPWLEATFNVRLPETYPGNRNR
jgi:hypothetical protein